jgi:type IV secretory pathway VirB10-like protein
VTSPAGRTPEAASVPPSPAAGHLRLLEGTLIETVLTTRLEGAFASPVACLVTTPVYAADYQRVAVPRGSRLLGTATPVAQLDQQRLAVAFHRLVLPSGQTVSLDRVPGLNQAGDTGLRDQVDHHYVSIFGTSLAVGAIAGLAQVNSRFGTDADWTDAYRQGLSSSVAQSSLRILDRFLNRLPTVTIREGHRVKVYLTGDVEVPTSNNPADLSRAPVR